MSAIDHQVEQCIRSIETRCMTLAAEGFCSGVVLSALLILAERRLADFAMHDAMGDPRSFINTLLERHEFAARGCLEDLIQKREGRTEA